MTYSYIAVAAAYAIVRNGIIPIITDISIIGLGVCTLMIIFGGYQYITCSGNPQSILNAKKVIKNALIGLTIILAAFTISNLLSDSYGASNLAPTSNSIPVLKAISPQSSSTLITIILKTITTVLASVIEMVASPFIKALSYFTSGTPLIADNSAVFNLWLTSVAVADALFVLAIALIGLHVMSFSSFGLEDINLKQLAPKIVLTFVFINSSLFFIDSVISLSNLLITAVSDNHAVDNLWSVLTSVVLHPSGYDLAILIIMVVFVIFTVILLIYYVGRLVTLYLGAVLSPIIMLCWLIPGLKDFAITATRRYITTIFVLFVHVIILELAASILSGVVNNSDSNPDPLMAMIVGLATLIALLKTQGVMAQLSFASMGTRSAKQLGERLIIGMSYLGGEAAQAIGRVAQYSNTRLATEPSLNYIPPSKSNNNTSTPTYGNSVNNNTAKK